MPLLNTSIVCATASLPTVSRLSTRVLRPPGVMEHVPLRAFLCNVHHSLTVFVRSSICLVSGWGCGWDALQRERLATREWSPAIARRSACKALLYAFALILSLVFVLLTTRPPPPAPSSFASVPLPPAATTPGGGLRGASRHDSRNLSALRHRPDASRISCLRRHCPDALCRSRARRCSRCRRHSPCRRGNVTTDRKPQGTRSFSGTHPRPGRDGLGMPHADTSPALC